MTSPDTDALLRHDAMMRQRLSRLRVQARYDRQTAQSAIRAARAPDANLRLIASEAMESLEHLRAENLRLRAELDELIALVG